jgi:steroid delta-isomerase-like uncharacterized protein
VGEPLKRRLLRSVRHEERLHALEKHSFDHHRLWCAINGAQEFHRTLERRKSMDTDYIERLLDEWATAWSSHDTDKVLALFTDDCLYEDVTFGVVNRGKAELGAFADGIFASIPDFKVELTRRFVANTSAGMEWVMSGTHKGDFPGMPATNKQFSIRGVTVVEVRGAKIRRNSDYWDAATVMRQVGLLPTPAI